MVGRIKGSGFGTKTPFTVVDLESESVSLSYKPGDAPAEGWWASKGQDLQEHFVWEVHEVPHRSVFPRRRRRRGSAALLRVNSSEQRFWARRLHRMEGSSSDEVLMVDERIASKSG